MLGRLILRLLREMHERSARVEPNKAAIPTDQREREKDSPVSAHSDVFSVQIGDRNRGEEVLERPEGLPVLVVADRAGGGNAPRSKDAKDVAVIEGGHPVDYVPYPKRLRLRAVLRLLVRGRARGGSRS